MRLTPDQQERFLDIIRRYPGRTASELKNMSPKVKWLVDRGGLRELESMRLIRYVPRGGSVAGGWVPFSREEEQTTPRCRHCGGSEVQYHDAQGDSYCSDCGRWHLDN